MCTLNNILHTLSGKSWVLQVDVSDLEAVKTILQSIDREEERLDVLVNNAATFIYEAAEDVTEEGAALSP